MLYHKSCHETPNIYINQRLLTPEADRFSLKKLSLDWLLNHPKIQKAVD